MSEAEASTEGTHVLLPGGKEWLVPCTKEHEFSPELVQTSKQDLASGFCKERLHLCKEALRGKGD